MLWQKLYSSGGKLMHFPKNKGPGVKKNVFSKIYVYGDGGKIMVWRKIYRSGGEITLWRTIYRSGGKLMSLAKNMRLGEK